MEFKLKDQRTENTLGYVNLDYIPKKSEAIHYNKELYTIDNIIHSEDIITILVYEDSVEITAIRP